MSSPIPLLRASRLSTRDDVHHGFTTRFDGSGGRLDLGRDATPERWSHVADAIGLAGCGVSRLHQVHGATVVQVDRPGPAGEGDALISTQPGLILAARTADCVPVLVVLGEPAIAVAAVHSGWRGTAEDIVGHTIRALRALDARAPLHAVIGPAISGPRYEVGEEVVAAISGTGVPEERFVLRPPDRPRPYADVRAAVRWQLEQHGPMVIETIDHCTFDDPSLWSHRRDGLARGSLAALVALAPR